MTIRFVVTLLAGARREHLAADGDFVDDLSKALRFSAAAQAREVARTTVPPALPGAEVVVQRVVVWARGRA